MGKDSLRDTIAQEFVKSLTEEQIPWRAAWASERPYNATTEKDYRGLNSLWLSYVASKKGYTDPRWATFKQARDNGWHVKKGEKATNIEFWSVYDKVQHKNISLSEADKIIAGDPSRKDDMRMVAKQYCVFNGEQIDGIPPLAQKEASVDIAAIRANRDVLLQNMGLTFHQGGDQAFYRPSDDSITMPADAAFKDDYGYMSVLLHECGHATGHESRLNRDLSGSFGSESYAKEELRAEIASAFTAQALGFGADVAALHDVMDNHKAYIQSWAKAIKDAPNELFAAIKDAEAISDYLIEKGEFERVPKTPELIDPEIEKKVIAGIENEFVKDEDRSLYDALIKRYDKEYPFLSPIEKSCLAASILPDEDIIAVGRETMAHELYELMSIDEERDCGHLIDYFDSQAIISDAAADFNSEKDFYEQFSPESEEYEKYYKGSFDEYMDIRYGVSEVYGTDEQQAIALLNSGEFGRERYFNHDKYLLAVVNGDVIFGPAVLLNRETNEVFTVPNITSDNKYIDTIVGRAEQLQEAFEKQQRSIDGKIADGRSQAPGKQMEHEHVRQSGMSR